MHDEADSKFEQEIAALEQRLVGAGVDSFNVNALIGLARQQGSVTDPLVIAEVQSAMLAAPRLAQEGREADVEAQANIQKERADAAGGVETLAVLDRAFEVNLVGEENISSIAAQFAPTIEALGNTQLAVDAIREVLGVGEATDRARFFPLGDPATAAGLEEIRGRFGIEGPDPLTTVVTEEGDASVIETLAGIGLAYRGLNSQGQIIAVDSRGKEFIYGTNEDGSIFRIGEAGKDGLAGGGGTGAAAVRLQNIGVDMDGFALVFNPATGSITKGPQVGFGQIDPRTIAAEESRQFNEQQGLREGEFLRDVLSNGRNFLTAAFLSRGQRGGSPLAETTQADLLRRGFGPEQALGGFNAALGSISPEDARKVPAFVREGLEEQGLTGGLGIDPSGFGVGGGGGGTLAGAAVRPGEIDPATLAGSGAPFGQTSLFATGDKGAALPTGPGFDGQGAVPATELGKMALAFAPPAVKDIAGGREVGALGTSGVGGFAIPLASPQTLANLTTGERGALSTTLQVTDQRTLEEFERESAQRFRGQGSRLATGV
jgi:hypothetical protein